MDNTPDESFWQDDNGLDDEAAFQLRGPRLDLNQLPLPVWIFLGVSLAVFLIVVAANGTLFVWFPWLYSWLYPFIIS